MQCRVLALCWTLAVLALSQGGLARSGGCASDAPPDGIYLVRIWDIGVDVMGQPTWTGHVNFYYQGQGVYVGDWLEYSDHFSAFYSASTQLLTGGWYSEGNALWGGINFRWDGVRLTGKWTWYGRNGTGYEEWFPAGEAYEVPPLPPQIPPEQEYTEQLP